MSLEAVCHSAFGDGSYLHIICRTSDGKSIVPLTAGALRRGVIIVLVPLVGLGSDQVGGICRDPVDGLGYRRGGGGVDAVVRRGSGVNASNGVRPRAPLLGAGVIRRGPSDGLGFRCGGGGVKAVVRLCNRRKIGVDGRNQAVISRRIRL